MPTEGEEKQKNQNVCCCIVILYDLVALAVMPLFLSCSGWREGLKTLVLDEVELYNFVTLTLMGFFSYYVCRGERSS